MVSNMIDYGMPDTVTTNGGLEYRFDFAQPDWEESEKTLADIGEVWLEFNDYGRKRNPKKARLRELVTEWNETDAYCAICALLHNRTPHPDLDWELSWDTYFDAVGNVFNDGDDGRELKDQTDEDSLPDSLRNEEHDRPDHPDRHEITLGELYGHWVYRMVEASTPSARREVAEELLLQAETKWAALEFLSYNSALYWGTANTVKVIADEFDVDDAWASRRRLSSTAEWFLTVSRGTVDPELQPHDVMGTMKANSTNASSVSELDQSEWLAQTKYDGARLFVHHAGDGDIRAYSSGSQDVTAALPELEDIDFPDCPFIFDCEATPYDDDGNPIPFENIMTRLTRVGEMDADDFDTDVVFKFFDAPVWHGRDITDRKYTDRFEVVKRIFDPENVARTGNDLESTFQSAVENGHEGLVIKRKDGSYTPGGRHSQWKKWKPEPETLDCVVVDVQQGSGRLSDRMGALSLGLLGPDDEVISVGRVGTGFSDSERKEWWVDHETDNAEGQVIEIEFEDIQYHGGWGLRFPRFKCRRPEGECDTVERAARLQDRDDDYDDWLDGREDTSLTDEPDKDLDDLFG